MLLMFDDIGHPEEDALSISRAARYLGISPQTLRRWDRSGKLRSVRHPISGYRSYRRGDLESLRLPRKVSPISQLSPVSSPESKNIFTIDPLIIERLEPQQAVDLFRDLLWCRARQKNIPVSSIHVSYRQHDADGGVDASIDKGNFSSPDELFVSGGTCFQIKTGRSAKPWQMAWLCKELFGASDAAPDRDHLAPRVRQCLEDGKRYVLICFGYSGDKLAQGQESLVQLLSGCGFANADVEVWGQDSLVGLLSRYPSLCLNIARRAQYEFQSHASWKLDASMLPELNLGSEQQQLILDIRESLRGDTSRHIRLIGPAGLGKTRLVMEATAVEDLAPAVVYVPHAEDFQKSSLFNALLRTDNDFFCILVIDECDETDRASIWSSLKRRSDRCRIVTIDHGPETASDELMRLLICPPLAENHIAEIIKGYVPESRELNRWAEFCRGSPRVAHAVGQNLQRNPDDVLKQPATVDLWRRFIDGFAKSDDLKSRHRRLVLRYASLFDRFGFEKPVQSEARFIARLAEEADPTLTWAQFQSVVVELRDRRILQGKTTLFIVPPALHVHLWLDFWSQHGRDISLSEFMGRIPPSMLRWFMEMFRYAYTSPIARQAIDDLLGPQGLLSSLDFAESDVACNFLFHLAEAAPGPTLRCIERTIGTWSHARLKDFDSNRQHIVWTLEKIAVWREYFEGAAKVLLRLAANENASNSNNATGTFAELFTIRGFGPVSPTEASPSERLPVLAAALTSPSADERAVGLKACAKALSTYPGGRIIGREHQGIRPSPNLWMPQIWGEVFDAHKAVWNLLIDSKKSWPKGEQTKAIDVLIQAASGLVHDDVLANMVLSTIEDLVKDDATDLRKVVEIITRTLKHHSERTPRPILDRLREIDSSIRGTTFESRLRRAVLFGNWDDNVDENGIVSDSLDLRIDGLAAEAVSDFKTLALLLPELTTATNNNIYSFSYSLAKRDEKDEFLTSIQQAYLDAGADAQTFLLCGYLRGIFEKNPTKWEKVASDLVADDRFITRLGELMWSSGCSETIFNRLLIEFQRGRLPLNQLRYCTLFARSGKIDQPSVLRFVDLLLTSGTPKAYGIAVDVIGGYFCEKDREKPLPEEAVYRLLSNITSEHGQLDDYHWAIIGSQFVKQHRERSFELFHTVLEKAANDRSPQGLPDRFSREVLSEIIKSDPARCWMILTSLLSDPHSPPAHFLSFFLRPDYGFGDAEHDGLIGLFPQQIIFDWIAIDSANRAPFIASVVRKSISRAGPGSLAREILVRYGHLTDVQHSLLFNFETSGWSGPASEHHRRRRDKVRSWLVGETDTRVIKWLEEYVEYLGRQITRCEIEEERRF
jgi:MerR family regulatory protein